MAIHLHSRAVVEVSGADASGFLQGLLTNDVLRLTPGAAAYAALLSPQGKYVADMLVHRKADGFWLDVPASSAETLLATFKRYKLRSVVALTLRPDLFVVADAAGLPADPRLIYLPTRGIAAEKPSGHEADYHTERLRLGILEGDEIPSERAFILDYGFEELHGVDFTKGCYVGQEVTARMHYKSIAKKGLYLLQPAPALQMGMKITAQGAETGEVLAMCKDAAVAILRHENATGIMLAGNIPVQATRPAWANKISAISDAIG